MRRRVLKEPDARFGAMSGMATGSDWPGKASVRFASAGSRLSGETTERWMSRLVSLAVPGEAIAVLVDIEAIVRAVFPGCGCLRLLGDEMQTKEESHPEGVAKVTRRFPELAATRA